LYNCAAIFELSRSKSPQGGVHVASSEEVASTLSENWSLGLTQPNTLSVAPMQRSNLPGCLSSPSLGSSPAAASTLCVMAIARHPTSHTPSTAHNRTQQPRSSVATTSQPTGSATMSLAYSFTS